MYFYKDGKLRMEDRKTSLSEAKTFRIVILGESGVGKSTIARGLVGKSGYNNYSTEHDFHEGLVEIGDKFGRLEIVDMLGNDQFPSMRSLAISLADICILVYSFDKKSSLDTVQKLEKEVKVIRGPNKLTPMAILGNKIDCSCKELSEQEALDVITSTYDYPHSFFSAKYTFGMTDIFKWIMAASSGVDGPSSKAGSVTPPRRSKKLWKKLRSRMASAKSPDMSSSISSDSFTTP